MVKKGTMKKLLTSLVIAFAITQISFAQQNSKEIEKEDIRGTYQIQILKHSRESMSLPDNIYQTIEDKRNEKQIVYHYISKKIRVKILPNNAISSDSFKPLAEQKIVPNF